MRVKISDLYRMRFPSLHFPVVSCQYFHSFIFHFPSESVSQCWLVGERLPSRTIPGNSQISSSLLHLGYSCCINTIPDYLNYVCCVYCHMTSLSKCQCLSLSYSLTILFYCHSAYYIVLPVCAVCVCVYVRTVFFLLSFCIVYITFYVFVISCYACG